MRAADACAVLERTPLFGELARSGIERVAQLAIARFYPRGAWVFHEGDSGDAFYVVGSGRVKVFVTSEQGDELVLASLNPSDTFGELAVIDGGPRTASAKAVEDTTLLALTRRRFLELLQAEPAVDRALHHSLGELLRRMLAQASDLVFLDLPGRVAKFLVTSLDRHAGAGGAGVVHLELTQGDLAHMIGGSRPSVNQILRAFEARGYVEVKGRSVTIKDADALRHRAGL
jgi:CRP/FNR family transcriptional regulator, cyclic AMP receptor protein